MPVRLFEHRSIGTIVVRGSLFQLVESISSLQRLDHFCEEDLALIYRQQDRDLQTWLARVVGMLSRCRRQASNQNIGTIIVP